MQGLSREYVRANRKDIAEALFVVLRAAQKEDRQDDDVRKGEFILRGESMLFYTQYGLTYYSRKGETEMTLDHEFILTLSADQLVDIMGVGADLSSSDWSPEDLNKYLRQQEIDFPTVVDDNRSPIQKWWSKILRRS